MTFLCSRNGHRWFAIMTILGLMLVSNMAFATSYIKFCAQWARTYVDASYGEDWYTSRNANVDTSALYAKYIVREGSATATPMQEGFLDGVGCTPNIPIEPSTLYYFTQGTWVSRDSRTVYVNTDTGSTHNNTINWYTHTFGTNYHLTPGAVYTHTFPGVTGSKANVMPVVGQIVGSYSKLGIPSNTLTRIRTDSDACTSDGAYYTFDGNVCIVADGDTYAWGDVTTWKFTMAHEIGHHTADETGGPFGGSYDASVSESKCKCDHINNYGSEKHCLQSRETSQAAQQEAFGHFFSSAVFNERVANNGKFVYPKPAFDNADGIWFVFGPPSPVRTYMTSATSNRWMNTHCNPGDVARGVELDWLWFYYEIWTNGTYRYSISEIEDIWDDATYYGWDNNSGSIKQAVESQWGVGTSKTLLFLNKAQMAGVDHG